MKMSSVCYALIKSYDLDIDLNMNIEHDTIISYFDLHEGPKLLMAELNSEEEESPIPVEEITCLMDIHRSGDFFIHYYKDTVSVNYCFGLKDASIRGGEHSLMASLIFTNHGESKYDYFGEIFSKMPEFEKWARKVSDSMNKSAAIKLLINNKRKEEYESQNALLNSLRRLVFS